MRRNLLQATRTTGFSLVELLVVVSVAVIVAAMAVPVMINASNAYQLRNATVELASALQKARIYCIQQNVTRQVITTSGGSLVFLDVANLGSTDTSNSNFTQWPQVTLPTNITQTSTSAPTISQSTLGFSTPQSPPAYFNGRGLPCAMVSGICTNWSTASTVPIGYIYYLRQSSNGTRWSAVSIMPGGQVKTWMYNGSTWSNL